MPVMRRKGFVSMRDTKMPMMTAMVTAAIEAMNMALKVRSRKAVSALPSRASDPKTQRRTLPTTVPLARTMSRVTDAEASVGALEVRPCVSCPSLPAGPTAGAAGQESS